MLPTFSPIFVGDTKTIFGYNFVMKTKYSSNENSVENNWIYTYPTTMKLGTFIPIYLKEIQKCI